MSTEIGEVQTITLRAGKNNQTIVIWDVTFMPQKGVEAKTATEVIQGVYRAGLDNLKQKLEL